MSNKPEFPDGLRWIKSQRSGAWDSLHAMTKKIAVIIGHPDPDPARFCRTLAGAYTDAAREASHTVRVIDIATLDFPLLRTEAEWNSQPVPPALREAHDAILWAEHLVIIYPLWLGDVPALLKGFLEQVLRPGQSVSLTAGPFDKKPLSGKSARVVVTMGMPAWMYRWVFGAHSLKSLKRNILWFVGIGPIRHSLIGAIAGKNPAARVAWLARLRKLGTAAK